MESTPSHPELAALPARVETLDILRGFALFGILFINIMEFRLYDHSFTGLDAAVNTLSLVLGEGKFLTTFMILFGASFAYQVSSVGSSPLGPRYLRRMAMLLVFGIAHFVLLWEGDILIQYVAPGLLLLLFARARPRTALAWSVFLYVAWFGLIATILVLTLPRSPSTAGSGDPTVPPVLYQTGTYAQVVQARLALLPAFLEEHGLSSLFLLPSFLLGMYLGKKRILEPGAWHRSLLRALLGVGLPLGLATNAFSDWANPVRFELAAPLQVAFVASTVLGLPALALAYIAGITLLSGRVRWLNPLAAVGRMSLTNYVLQSTILTTLFYGYGLGWYDKVGPALGVVILTAIYLVQIPLSVYWLRYFRYGPLEWLWRCVTYRRVAPLRAQTPAAAPA